MHIKSITLKNYRLFRDFTCDFDPGMTVLVADNGGGKTTILDAIRTALVVYLAEFGSTDAVAKTLKSANLKESDVFTFVKNGDLGQRQVHFPADIEVAARLDDSESEIKWHLIRSRTSAQQMGGCDKLRKYAANLQIAYLEGSFEQNWPLIAAYGTSRLWAQKAPPDNLQFADGFDQRHAAYEDCIESASSYKLVLEWLRFAAKTDFAEKMKFADTNPSASIAQLQAFRGPFSSMLNAVQQAMNTVLAPTGWRKLYYSETYKDALVEHDEFGTQPVSQLSDGIRNSIALVADLAYRAVQLNPHLGEGAALESSGIVLIDEVDMHLHPSWQQTILISLREAFPKIQFIVTTHSPQVLSTVKRENIRHIGKNRNNELIASPPLAMTYGEPSGDVLQAVMFVDQQPPVPEKADLQRLTSLIDQGLYDSSEVSTLTAQLKRSLGEHHAQLQRLQRSIQRQRMLNK
jgi:predicted ATP-binding protein involved in virulence